MRLGINSYKLAIAYGFILWLVPFMVSIAIFPLKSSAPALFESIMPVVLTVSAVSLLYLYFRRLKAGYLKEGMVLGVLWLFISIAFDLLMFMWGPIQMTFADYMMDIGTTYLIYPIITIGTGYIIEKVRGNGGA